MFLFGITGGIGSGKSTVGKLLKEKGVPIIEAAVTGKTAIPVAAMTPPKIGATEGA